MSDHQTSPAALPEERIEAALAVAYQYAGIDGDHHRKWVIDQMLRALLGPRYDEWIAEWNTEDGDPHAYEWDGGIAP